ncbi:MAG: hypothetical protein A3J73_07260 [Planctomycetes bacterium RIFCSPHIGHO2_02_FULL_38_41]|nr:MAG: hypothetical protein A3J73_07260 [Planctomycetes bacterium RIFCSPHIGHO2_02_FULL_38_41]OHB97383.1 MAG: hypothetical protein A2W74_06155 [Planctomycetes bacterium RIFCSPLOWO2_12_38_17]
MKRRAIVFCIVAIILLVLTHAVFALWVGDYTWYEHDPRVSIVTTILAIIYVFFPFAASKTLSLFLEIPLGIIALAEILGCYILVVLICSLEVGIAIGILYITGSVLILGGYTLGDYTVGGPLVASIGTIAFVTILLLFGIRFYKTTRKLVKNTWYSLWHIFEAWVPYPGLLMAKIWDIATQLGEFVAGRVYFTKEIRYLITNNDWNGCVKLGKSAVRPLIATLKDKINRNRREEAAKALGEIGDSRAVQPLIALLKDEKDENVVGKAELALCKLGKPAVEPLIAALKDANSPSRVRYVAASALGRIGDIRALDTLIAALKDADSCVREGAALALSFLVDRRALEPLVAALKDVDDFVRINAAMALGEIKDRQALEPLVTALKDENCIVRMFAATALGEIRDDRAVEPLIVLLKGESGFVRQAAAGALGEIGDSRAEEPLMLALKDVDERIREEAKEALGKIKSREDLGVGQQYNYNI